MQATKKRTVPAAGAGAGFSISGFDVLERVGSGGMAVVWKAYQNSLDRWVAVKILRPEFAADPQEVALFMNEARAAAKLSHPNIVQVYDTGSEGGAYYFVMEFVAGQTVGRILRAQGALTVKQALRVTVCVAEALDYAWRKAGIVHRDVKPDNIMIDEDDVVKVADLGLAKVGRGSATANAASSVIEGTPNYMAPEQVQGANSDCRSDVYALGATLYHMVTGRMPFDGLTAADAMQGQLNETIPNPRDINPRLPMGVSQLVTRMMMKDPEKRPADWSEALRDIKRVAAGRVLLMKPAAGYSTVAAAAVRTPAQARSVAGSRTPAVPPLWRSLRFLGLTLIWVVFALWLLLPFARGLRDIPQLEALPAPVAPGMSP